MISSSTVTTARDHFFMCLVDIVMLAGVCCKHSFNLLYRLFRDSLQHRLQHDVEVEDTSYFFIAQISMLVTYVHAGERIFIFLIPVYEIAAAWTMTYNSAEHALTHPRRGPKIVTVPI